VATAAAERDKALFQAEQAAAAKSAVENEIDILRDGIGDIDEMSQAEVQVARAQAAEAVREGGSSLSHSLSNSLLFILQ